MEYGQFDSKKREYVITRPDTPAPWANYLGSPEYGAIITNHAGGYSFVKSGAAGRILRYRFNEEDKPGRYVYFRDDADGDFWSASWQPVGKPLDKAQYKCRHGLGYSVMDSAYRGIESSVLYYVPLDATYEVWQVEVANKGDTPRDLSIFGYAEFTCDGNYEQDQVNLQYTQYITRTYFEKSFIRQAINENCKNAVNGSAKESRVFILAGAPVTSYCGDREQFLGTYGGYSKPAAVTGGACDGSLNYGGNPCGALHTKITLKPGEKKIFCFVLGQKESETAVTLTNQYASETQVATELDALKKFWGSRIAALNVNTPDQAFNEMVNTWNAYQCYITFTWSRAASLAYCGLRNGYGYRDTVQDIQGIIHLSPEMAKEKIHFMISAQVDHGGALPLVKYSHKAGHENTPETPEYSQQTGHPSYRADDALWLFPTVWKYIAETGDVGFLDEVIPYANKGSDTVYRHLLRAIDFSLEHSGIHGLPAGLHADWNDCLRLGAGGVSVFVALQLYWAFDIVGRFAAKKGDKAVSAQMEEGAKKLANIIETHCWSEDRFVRGISEKGEVVGAKSNAEASLWMNPQVWAVISGYDRGDRAKNILQLVYDQLNTPYGVKLMTPPFAQHPFDGALALLFNPGMKENAGIFLQTQGWAVLSEALMGNGERALQYYRESCPAAQNGIAEIRKLEPYVYSQFTESDDSPHAGRSHVHWLTGTASTVMVGCVEGILGLRPDMDGLRLSPAIPKDWPEFTMEKQFRGKLLKITVRNKGAAGTLTVNGKAVSDNYIPASILADVNEITLEI